MRIATRLDRHGVTLARLGLVVGAALAAWEAFVANDLHLHNPYDKAGHFTVFYTLTLLSLAAFPRGRVLVMVAVLAAIGGGIELIQALPVVGRDAEWGDFIADCLGIGYAVAPALAWRVRRLARERSVD